VQSSGKTKRTKFPMFFAAESVMKKTLLLAATALISTSAGAQEFVKSQPAGRTPKVFSAMSGGLVGETAATARELVTFRDPKWTLLTIAQIAAATADAETSLHNFRSCSTCVETGISRLVVGSRPDVHKYAIAGLVEIGVEAVTAHYLRNHGPARKWYRRYIWTLPQTFSLYEHTRADFHNVGLKLRCDDTCLHSF
jgi:hypothetical protein